MRLKTFTAPTIHEVMKQIREQLGENAVIVSTQSLKKGKAVRVTAAVDPDDPEIKTTEVIDDCSSVDKVKQVLDYHQVSQSLKDEIVSDLSLRSNNDLVSSLSISIEKILHFDTLTFNEDENIMLVGMPGAGKTMTAIKLATRAKMMKCPIRVVSTDFVRPCSIDEMKSFTRLLKLDLFTAKTPEELENIQEQNVINKPLIIDTPGINPFQDSDLSNIKALAESVASKMVLVLPAGVDPAESLEIADAFKTIGCQYVIGSKMDLAHRLGNLMEVIYQAGYGLTDFGVSRHPVEGLEIATPQFLAKLMLENI